MRILWLSNAPWAGSGYGSQSALFLPRFQTLGHDVAAVANWGVNGKTDEWEGITVYPTDSHWGNTATGTYADTHNADTVIALCDAFVLRPDDWPDGLRMAVWAPVDHYPLPPPVLAVLAHDKVTPIAMSRFGEEQMRTFKLDPIYVPHGVDTSVFYPRRQIRGQAREILNIPEDAFLVGMVAANKGNVVHRKGFPEAFAGFAQFAKQHPDAWLYAHTQPHEPGGMNLDRLATVTGVPEGRLRFPNESAWHLGISSEIMSVLYQAFDVLLMPSMGEGFGIPLLEAQACGVPVIASNHSAMVELCQAGWLVQGQQFWDEAACSFFVMPFIDSIAAALEQAYETREDMELREAAATFAQTYDADLVTSEFWVPALERLVHPPAPKPSANGLNRAQRRKLAKARA